MTLSRKIIIRNVAVLAGVMLLGGAALTGLWQLRGQVDVAMDEYAEQAADSLAQYLDLQSEAQEGSTAHEEREAGVASTAATTFREIALRIEDADTMAPPKHELEAMASEVRTAVAQFQELTREADNLVSRTGRRASSGVHDTLFRITVIFLLIVASTIVISILQYRGVILPLRSLANGVRGVAAGRFSERLRPGGDREFASLAEEFNRMAVELDDLYRGLEEKVAAKSRELVRSERLASVGFLAAGVAHEINNPLLVISGYAELSLRRLKQASAAQPPGNGASPDDEPLRDALRDSEQSLKIIRDESFRCKQITEKLLSLSEQCAGVHEHGPVSLASAARDVAVIVRAHEACRDRELVLRVDNADPLATRGSEPEIKQVLLNLVINGLEAVEPRRGQVTVEGGRNNGWVELRVSDNGCGMSPDVLEHVFEPFFSEKRGKPAGTGRRGLGLGLSISHAIVEGHGGQLSAESPGRPDGVGSRFVLRLPAADAVPASPQRHA